MCSSLKALSFHAEAHENEPETTKIDRQTVAIGATSPPVGRPFPPAGTSSSGSIEPVYRPFCTEFAAENASSALLTFCRCPLRRKSSVFVQKSARERLRKPHSDVIGPPSAASSSFCGSGVGARSSPLDRCRERLLLSLFWGQMCVFLSEKTCLYISFSC